MSFPMLESTGPFPPEDFICLHHIPHMFALAGKRPCRATVQTHVGKRPEAHVLTMHIATFTRLWDLIGLHPVWRSRRLQHPPDRHDPAGFLIIFIILIILMLPVPCPSSRGLLPACLGHSDLAVLSLVYPRPICIIRSHCGSIHIMCT